MAGLRFVVVTHGQSADPFWSVVANGVGDAAEALGVEAEYQAPGRFDMVEMAHLLEAAIASRPDGIALSLPDADALAGSVRAAVDAGLPVVSLNSGSAAFERLGIQAHVGQPEYEAGLAAGRRMADRGVARALCVNQEVGNLALDRRCEGFGDGLREAGGEARVVTVELADPDDSEQRILGALDRDRTVDGLLTLGPTGAAPSLAALERLDRPVSLATFDLSPEILEGIRRGDILFAVDQQPYVQGYLPVVLLTLAARTGAMPVGVVRTGPSFVTPGNVEAVAEGTERGIR